MKSAFITFLASLVLLIPNHSPAHSSREREAMPPIKILKVAAVAPVSDFVAQTGLDTIEVAPAEPVTPVQVTGCGSDSMMAYIYTVESGCRTNIYNYLGCRGLGQACPGSKLPCSDSDWSCQDNWFKEYCISAYGSIYNCYIFRTQHNWY